MPDADMSQLVFDAADEAGHASGLGAALAEVLPRQRPWPCAARWGPARRGWCRPSPTAGVDRRDVVSPTFVLIQEYHGRRTIYHIDAYRLATRTSSWHLGLEEYFDRDGLVLIEWADAWPTACRASG